MTGEVNIYPYNTRPINKMAARVFFKTPWWAEYTGPAKKYVEDRTPLENEISVDYFKPPPPVARNETPIPDRRGTKFEYHEEENYKIISGTCVVTGYAHSKVGGAKAKRNARRPHYWCGEWDKGIKHTQRNKVHRWYVLFPDGSFRVMRWGTIKKRIDTCSSQSSRRELP